MAKSRYIVLTLCLLSLGVSGCDYMPSWMGGAKKQQEKLPGVRTSVLPQESELVPDPSIASLTVAIPPVYANTDWAQHTGVVNSGSANLMLLGTLDTETHATAGEGDSFEHTLVPRPVVAGGVVYAMDAVGHISAHAADNIDHVLWKSDGVAEEDEPDTLGGGLAYYEGHLYATSGRGRVAAFDAATGKELWHKLVGIPFRSAPRVLAGRIFAITIDNQTFAFNIANGEILWNQRGVDESAGIMNSISPAVDGDIVIAPYSSGELFAISAVSGKEMWNDSLALNKQAQADNLFTGIGGDPVIDGEVVFAVSANGTLAVYSIAQGRRVWDKPISSLNTPWVAGDFLYLLSDTNHVICFVKYSGAIRWATRLPSYEDEEEKKHPITWKGPVMVNGKLAIVGSNGQMVLISAADGSIAETKEIPDGIYTPPVVAGGRMYLVGQNAELYSLQ